jgi:Clostripain family
VTSEQGRQKPWAVLAYTIADDKGGGDSLDGAAKEELKSLCSAADFGHMNVAAQVDFKHTAGVFRGVLTEPSGGGRGFEAIPADSHPLWRGIKARLDRSKLRVLKDRTDLNATRTNVLQSFLRFGQRECPAERYVVFFYGHGYGPLGIFFDAEADDRSAKSTMPLTSLSTSVHSSGVRAAVIVFRSCLANTIETAYELREAGEYMIASQSIVPIAGIWPWASFFTCLMPGAASGDVALGIARQLALFLETPANREPFADVPYSLVDLGASSAVAAPLEAVAAALETARDDPARRSSCAAALEASRIGFPGDPANPGDPALVDVPTLCDQLARLGRDPVAGPARALGEIVAGELVKWHHSQKGRHRGVGLYYQPVTAKDIEGSHLYDEGTAEADAGHYRQLALSQATGWDRIALNPLRP